MKKLWLLALSLTLVGLALAQTQQQQVQPQQPQQVQQQQQAQVARPHQDFATLDPNIDYAFVRLAHLSPNAPAVSVFVLSEDVAATQPATTDPAATTQQPATAQQQQVQQQPATVQQQQVGTGMLEVTVEPADAIINITGPEGYEDMFTGSQVLSNLMPGTYIVSATRQGFEPASEEVGVGEGESATVALSLQETEGDEAVQLRQQEQPLTAEQQQQLQAREQQVAQQQVQQQPVQQDWQPMQQPGMVMGTEAFQNISYEEVTGYIAIPAGDYRVQIVTADGNQLAYEGTRGFSGGAYYTMAAIGFVLEDQTGAGVQPVVEDTAGGGFFDWLGGLFGADGGPDPDDLTIRLQLFDDEPGTFPRAGEAHIRVIHASAGSPDVDVVWSLGPVAHTPQQQAAAQPVQQPATAQQPQAQAVQQQEGMGNLDVIVEPADALVSIVGPDGYEDFFSGAQTLVNLVPGNYVVSATRQGYEAAVEEVNVSEGETATVELTLEESAGDDAVQLRQQEQPLTAEQQQQLQVREQQVAQQQVQQQPAQQPGAVPTDPATQQPGTVQDPAAAPATQPGTVQDPAVTDPATTDPAFVEPAGQENVIVGGLAYSQSSGYQAVRAMGNFGLQVVQAGDEMRTVLMDLSGADIRPGYVYTIFISGTTFEDFALGYIKVADARLGGGTDEDTNGMWQEDMQEDDNNNNDNND